MTLNVTEALDSRSLLGLYEDKGIHLSYRQLREWERAGIIHSSRVGLRKKVFAPVEVKWVGFTCLLKLAGQGLSSIKEMRMAAAPTPLDRGKLDPRIKKRRLAEMASLLEKQRETAEDLRVFVSDAISVTDAGVVITEYKRPKQRIGERNEENTQRQAEFYKRVLESKGVKFRIRVIRVLRGLSQQELAKKLAFSQARLSQIENGWVKPDEREKNRIAHALNEGVSVLFPD